jgi:hypothetical protein
VQYEHNHLLCPWEGILIAVAEKMADDSETVESQEVRGTADEHLSRRGNDG